MTETAVYHWSAADATSPPQKVFDRHATLVGAQIINYRCSADEKWLVLVGISGNSTNPSAFKIKGCMQLYSRDRGVSQPIEGHAAAFAEIKLDGLQHPTKLFTFSVRTGAGAKVFSPANALKPPRTDYLFSLASHRRDRSSSPRSRVHQKTDRRLLPSRGHQRFPGRDAGLKKARNCVLGHQIRFHSPLRPRIWRVYLHEPDFRRDHLRYG